jgi:hypothetical protein
VPRRRRLDLSDRRLIRIAQVSGDTAVPAAENVAANTYRWEHGTVSPSDRYRP